MHLKLLLPILLFQDSLQQIYLMFINFLIDACYHLSKELILFFYPEYTCGSVLWISWGSGFIAIILLSFIGCCICCHTTPCSCSYFMQVVVMLMYYTGGNIYYIDRQCGDHIHCYSGCQTGNGVASIVILIIGLYIQCTISQMSTKEDEIMEWIYIFNKVISRYITIYVVYSIINTILSLIPYLLDIEYIFFIPFISFTLIGWIVIAITFSRNYNFNFKICPVILAFVFLIIALPFQLLSNHFEPLNQEIFNGIISDQNLNTTILVRIISDCTLLSISGFLLLLMLCGTCQRKDHSYHYHKVK